MQVHQCEDDIKVLFPIFHFVLIGWELRAADDHQHKAGSEAYLAPEWLTFVDNHISFS